MGLERLQKMKDAQKSLFTPSTTKALQGAAKLESMLQFNESDKGKEVQYAEVNRIVDLPVVEPMSPEEVDEYSREHLLAGAYNGGFRLFPTQANAHFAISMYGGLLGPIGVGWGKTLIMLMGAHLAFLNGHDRMMLMLPPEVLDQLVNRDIPWARKRVPLGYPIHVMGGKAMNYRQMLARSGKKGLYIMPYSLLSQKDGEENLNLIAPTWLGLDEAHRVAREGSARAGRIDRYLKGDGRDTELVALSGTITSKSVMDYYPLARAALKRNCPLPLTSTLARAWGAVIDANVDDWQAEGEDLTRVGGAGPIAPLLDWARKKFPDMRFAQSRDGFREAFRMRLVTCPGVVSSGDADIACSLIFENRPIEKYKEAPGWERLKTLIDQVELMWLTPNGDEIDHAFHTWKWLNELSSGFYNQLTWPTGPEYAKRKNISEQEAEDILHRAKEHHTLGQEYHKSLRQWLGAFAKAGLDTPMLVGNDMARNGPENVGHELYETWKAWKDADFEGRPERDSTAVRICPFKVNAAADWAQHQVPKNAGAILWVSNIEMGAWLHEELNRRNIDCLHAPAGANEAITDPANAGRKIVASLTAHGTGKNLQHFQHQCMVQWPRSAKTAEQLLGRLHRNGQEADEISAVTLNTLEFDHVNFAACLNDALYIHLTTGVRQKMIYGTYNPMPKIFPSAVLRRRGAENIKMLNEEQQAFLQEKFGT